MGILFLHLQRVAWREPLEKLVLPQFAHACRAYSRAVLQNFTILRVVVGWLVDG